MRRALLLPLAVLVSALAGCGGGGASSSSLPSAATSGAADSGGSATTSAAVPATVTPAPAATTAPPGTVPGDGRTVLVYFLRGEKLGVAHRTAPDVGVAAVATQALLAGPSAAERAGGLTSAVPPGTAVRALRITGGTAEVDLSGPFAVGAAGAVGRRRLGQLVYTLTQFPSVRSVRLLVDGAPSTSLGDLALSRPQTRADVEGLAPAILVEWPAVGEQVGSPLVVRGSADTFEGTFVVEVQDAHGQRLGKGVVQATSGSGTRGTFSATIPYNEAGGSGALVAYEPSAEDGAPLHRVEIPLRLAD